MSSRKKKEANIVPTYFLYSSSKKIVLLAETSLEQKISLRMKELEYYLGVGDVLTSMAGDTWCHSPVLVLWTWLLPVLYIGLIWQKQTKKKNGINEESFLLMDAA